MTDYFKRWPIPKTFTEVGDEVKGELVAYDAMSEKYPVIHVKTAGGMVRIVRITQARLLERIAELNPNIGDRILIRYEGEAKKAAPGMNRVKEFTVEVRRQGSRPAPPSPVVDGPTPPASAAD